MKAPSVLLVAGVYYPEISAAGLQCQAVAAALRGRARLSVLVTAVDPALPSSETIDGVPVTRVGVDVRSGMSKASASVRMIGRLAGLLPRVDVIHMHGFSQKNVPIAVMATLLRKPVVLTLHTSGQDEPQAAAQRGRWSNWAFRSARLVLPVSPNLVQRCEEAGVPAEHVRLTPNGIDTNRFLPATDAERSALRRELGWPDDAPVVVFVGFFSRDKRPDLLFRAWRRLADQGVRSKLVYIGAKASAYFEVDEAIAREIRERAEDMGRASDVVFVEPTHAMERYYRAADVFVLSSVREANPVALLEAMACGLPCIASRIDGATDVIIDDGVNGRLVDRDDVQGLARTLGQVLNNPGEARELGRRARETVMNRYDIQQTAERWLDAYRTVLG